MARTHIAMHPQGSTQIPLQPIYLARALSKLAPRRRCPLIRLVLVGALLPGVITVAQSTGCAASRAALQSAAQSGRWTLQTP